MWTDEELAKNERIAVNNLNDDRLMSLYRLARLGLAAEQVALAWQRNEVSDTKVPLTILDHPAWRDK